MNKNLNKSAYSLFARSKYDNAQEVQNLRCAFLCELSTRARTFILTLVLALTMVASSAFQIGNFAFAEDTETVITGTVNGKATKIAVVNGATTRVATTEQFKLALSRGIRNIIVDPQAAELLTDNLDENNGKGAVTYDGTFYIPIDEPLDISHNINISSDVPVVFARTSGFNRNPEKPAMFNVDSNGNLTLNGDITMTGEVVEATFNEGQGYVEGTTAPVALTDDTGNLYLGANMGNVFDMRLFDSPTGFTFEVGADGRVICYKPNDSTPNYVKTETNYGFALRTSADTSSLEVDLRLCDLNGATIEKLESNQEYVLYHKFMKKFLKKNPDGSFTGTDDIDDAVKFKAGDSSSDDDEGETTEGQDYIAPSLTFDVSEKVWEKSEIAEGGYFIHSDKAGREVTINEGVTLTELVTAADVKNVAPVVIAGGSKFYMNGGVISNNTVGYGAKEADSNGKSIQYIQNKLENTDMTNTAGGVILKGEGTEGTFTSGEISGNRADAGGVIVTGGAKVTMSDGFEIKNNVGYHHAGAAQVERGGIFIMNGGTMSGNVAWYKGGAVWATQWGTNGYADIDWSQWPKQFPELKNEGKKGADGVFVMNGANAKIENNTAFARGGAIEVESNGVVLEEGTIQKNNCRSLGGAIYVEGDAQSYSYTLVINDGYIGNNRSVMHAKGSSDGDQAAQDNHTLNRYLNGGQLQNGGGDSWDNSFNGAMGNGGGVWLCPVGGSSVFANNTVNIDNNSAQRNKGGTDFYLHRGNGAMLVQNIAGSWVDENVLDENGNPKGVNFNQENGSVLNGPTSLRNDANPALTQSGKKIIIKENISRDGGGIAANGTLLFGPPENVDRYDARITITKEWVGIDPTNVTFEIGFLDENGDFVSLKDTVTDKDGNEKEVNYEFQLDGRDDEASSSADESPANGGSAVGETAPENGKWKATAFIPAAVTLSNGTRYALYEFENPNGGANLSPANIDDLPKIRKIIEDGGELKIAEGTWKLKVREKDANFKVTIRDIKVNNTATAAPYNDVPLYDPVDGTRTSGFRVYFSTVELDQDIKNEGKGIEFTKLASDTGRPLEGTEFYLTETGTGNDWFVKGTRRIQDGATLEGSVIEDLALHEDPLTPNAQGKVQLTTGMVKEGKSLTVPGTYLLFETKAPEGYARKTSPWLVEIDNLGRVKITEVDSTQQGKFTGNGLTAVSGKSTESAFNTWWLKEWYTNSNAINTNLTLTNDWEPITIKKVDASTGSGKQGATFELYEAEVRDCIGVLNSEKNPDAVKPVNAKTLTSDQNGNIQLPITKPGVYLLFETNAPSGYIRAESPWLVHVDANKNVKIVANQSNKGEVGYHQNVAPYYPWGKNAYPSTRDELNEWVIEKWWRPTWYNVSGKTHDQHSAAPLENPTFQWISNDSSKFVSENKLPNSKANVELTKINSKTNAAITTGTAEFSLFEANVSTTDLFPNGTANTENVVVQVKNKNNPIGGTNGVISTDANGKLNLNNLDVDKVYLLFETKAPTGYERSKTPWLIWVKKDGTHEIYKYAASKVKHGSDNTVYPLDHSGLIGWTKQFAELGSLKFPTKDTEVGTPTGTNGFNYVKQVNGDKNDDNLKNVPIEIEFEKLSEDSDLKLTTAKFDLYYATVDDSTVYASDNGKIYKVDKSKGTNGKAASNIAISDGKYKISGIESNQIYLLFETNVPEGYVDPVLPWGIYVDPDGNADVINGTNYGFWRLKDEYTDEQIDAIKARFANVTDKTKIYLECKEIEPFNTYQLENKRKPIELYKVNEIEGANAGKLAGAEFVICKIDTDGDDWYVVGGRQISGSTVWSTALTIKDSKVIGPTTTDGKITIDGLDPGKYFIFEKKAPNGFNRSKSPWLLTVKEESATGYTWTLSKVQDDYKDKVLTSTSITAERHINDVTAQSVETQATYLRWWSKDWFENAETDNNQNFILRNEPKYLTKIDVADVNANNPVGLNGAAFTLYSTKGVPGTTSGNTFYKKEGKTYSLSSDTNGKIELPSEVTGKEGTYLLFEDTAPNGYTRSETPWLVIVSDTGSITVRRFNPDALAYNHVNSTDGHETIGNASTPYYWRDVNFVSNDGWSTKYVVPNTPNEFNLTKVDAYDTSKKLQGASFIVYEASRNGDRYSIKTSGKRGETSRSNPNGVFTMPSFVRNTVGNTHYYYLLFENEAPQGYEKESNPWLVMFNFDGRGNPMAWPMTEVEGKTGVYEIVYYGKYGNCNQFIKNIPSINLTKVDLGSIGTPTVTGTGNNRKEIVITGNGTEYMDGVGFQLYKTNNTWSTNTANLTRITLKGEDSNYIKWTGTGAEGDAAKGVLELGNLEDGKYLLYERVTKEGFALPAHPWRIQVSRTTTGEKTVVTTKIFKPADSSGSEYIELTTGDTSEDTNVIYNSQLFELPKSGGMGTYWFMIIGMGMMTFAVTTLLTRKFAKK